MKITICQLSDSPSAVEREWPKLKTHLAIEKSDMLVLPEMPFFSWPCSRKTFDPAVWQMSVDAHREYIARLGELSVGVVAGSMPANRDRRRFNVGFIWTRDHGLTEVHRKHFLPEMAAFYEATWYDRGPSEFETAYAGDARFGFAICTELWAMEIARHYGRVGVHVILTPRATGRETVEKWLAAGRTAGVVAGAYSVSSNRFAPERDFGGHGWISSPDGKLLAETNELNPFATADCDWSAAERAKSTYPRDAINH
jgi:predicted amidohydrolase